MTSYQVDPAQLHVMAQRLRSIRSAIEATPQRLGATAEELGSPRLAARLEELSRNWSRRRAEIVEHVDGLAQALDASGRAYADTEATIRRAAGS